MVQRLSPSCSQTWLAFSRGNLSKAGIATSVLGSAQVTDGELSLAACAQLLHELVCYAIQNSRIRMSPQKGA